MDSHRAGCIITGINGLELNLIERKLLQNPHILGVILFARNFQSKSQLINLIQSIQEQRNSAQLPTAVIAIDHEGGFVQRLKGVDFTDIPSPGLIGRHYNENRSQGVELVRAVATVTSYELSSLGINLCLGPRLDLSNSHSQDKSRYWDTHAQTIIDLSNEYLSIMQNFPIECVPKHFPGTSHSSKDTHFEIVMSNTTLSHLINNDISPYMNLNIHNKLQWIMLSHSIYKKIDKLPIPISTHWINDLIREKINYRGIIATDCIQMQGAIMMGTNLKDRTLNALKAGCNVIISSQTPYGFYKDLHELIHSNEIELILNNQNNDIEQNLKLFFDKIRHVKIDSNKEKQYLESKHILENIPKEHLHRKKHFSLKKKIKNLRIVKKIKFHKLTQSAIQVASKFTTKIRPQ